MYDAMTEFNSKTNRFECRHCRCEMQPVQGFFADPGTPDANMATALICSGCGHALDALIPMQILGMTPDDDAMIACRFMAAGAMNKLFSAFEEWHLALAAYERRIARQAKRQERRNNRVRRARWNESLSASNLLAASIQMVLF